VKKLTPILLICLALSACADVMRPHRLVYRQFFPNSGCCFVDQLPSAPKDLELGRSHVNELGYNWDRRSGKLEFIAPQSIVENTSPSVGAFDTRAYYGPKSSFTIIAVFQNPIGPHLPVLTDKITNAWAVGVAARNGDIDDYVGLLRFTVTLKVRNALDDRWRNTAYFNIQGINPTIKQTELTQDMYDWIFKDKLPFMIEVYFDRASGSGFARLVAGGGIYVPFPPGTTLAIPDMESISAIGATLGNCCSPGFRTAVELKDFQIWTD
jgi:hypothetical protein